MSDADQVDEGRWERISDLFGQALDLAEAEREAFVRERAGESALADEVLDMLASHEASEAKGTGSFDPNALQAALEQVAAGSTAVRESPDASIGRVVAGKYRLERLLGTGGMGAVYAATHAHNRMRVAVKVMHGGLSFNPAMRERFVREARVLASLEHPNIVKILDSGQDAEGAVYMAMALLEGSTLRERLERDGALEPSLAVDVACQTLDALGAAHSQGIVHRDIKPPNVVLVGEEAPLAKVLDFGIAKLANPEEGEQITRTGQIFGTLAYMSPEQLRTERVDARSDLYAAGALLYELLSGRPPFEGSDDLELASRVTRQEPAPLAGRVPRVSRELSDACLRLLEKRPADRHQTALEAAHALKRAIGSREGFGGDWEATTAERLTPAVRRKLRRRVTLAAVAFVGSVAVAGAGVAWLGLRDPVRPPVLSAPTSPSPEAARFSREFVLVPAAEATIGFDRGRAAGRADVEPEPDESPSHVVALAPYYLCTHEVTRGEYAAFVAATGREAPASWGGASPPEGTSDLPVAEVSWADARAYAEWRSARERVRYRLPTEAEWEYAAHGPDGRVFPWGDDWSPEKAYADRDVSGPIPVGGEPTGTSDRSPFGLTGMAGNVSEWTADRFSLYPGSPYRAKAGDEESVVVRGGRFNARPTTCRTTFRQWVPPSTKDARIGFRLAADPPSS